MKLQRIKKLFLKLCLFSLLFISFSKPQLVFSNEKDDNLLENYIRETPENNFYILGPGDVLKLKVSEFTSDLNKIFSINGEGTTNLERLNRIYVSGLTIKELTKILNKEYANFVKDPNVQIEMVNYRPISIYIDGEVENPGLHVLRGSYSTPPTTPSIENLKKTSLISSSLSAELNLNKFNNNSTSGMLFPSLIDVIRASGGVTINADLKNIRIERINSISNGSGKIITTLNIIDSLDLKDNSQNIRILDGDTIFISKNDDPTLSQIAKAVKSNINPKLINIYIGGRVNNPGKYSVSKNATLNEAIVYAGGTKVLKGPIKFIRYNSDGSVDKRKFGLRDKAKRGSYKNPYLKNGDVVFVGNSAFNITNEVLSEVISPFQNLMTGYLLIDRFTD